MNVHFRNIIEDIFIRQVFNKCECLTQSGEVPKNFFIIKLKMKTDRAVSEQNGEKNS